jgi:plasmid stabilization system protein ParE
VRLIWAEAAEADLEAIIHYIAQDSVTAALAVEDRIRRAAERLLQMPRMGRTGQIPGTYELVVHQTSHFLVYDLEGDAIHIFHVTHGRRQWPPSGQ